MKSIPLKQAAFLLDIFRSVEVIRSYVAGQTSEQFLEDGKTQDAVLRRILVAGEAAARLTPETCAEFPGIPFRKIVGMRNRVVHDYGHVDFEIVWETVQTHYLRSSRNWKRTLPNGQTPDREPMPSQR